jgi:hypothetical protein
MKRLLTLIAAAILAQADAADAHGPTRKEVTETLEIAAAPDAVWNIVKDFGKPQAWMPMVAAASETGGNDSGASRELTLKNGGVVKESLKTYDAANRTYHYRITHADPAVLPVSDYSSKLKVEASGGGAKVVWWGAFYRSDKTNSPPPEQNDAAAVAAVTVVFKESLENLKTLAEQGAHQQATARQETPQASPPRKPGFENQAAAKSGPLIITQDEGFDFSATVPLVAGLLIIGYAFPPRQRRMG